MGAVPSLRTLSFLIIGTILISIDLQKLCKRIQSQKWYNILPKNTPFSGKTPLSSNRLKQKRVDNLLIINSFFRDPAGARTRDPNIKSVENLSNPSLPNY